MGEAAGLTAVHVAELELLTRIHDVGAAWAPAQTLFKEAPLVPDELLEMKQHVVVGAEVASATPGLEKMADQVRHHHERWDGSGYPDGLKGSEIPIQCRILAIVDAYCSMTSNRPYRKAMTHQEALDEIVKCKGTQFDPDLVDAFVALERGEA